MTTVDTSEGDVALMDIAAVAVRLDVSERYVRRLVEERRIAYHKIGKFVRFHPDDVAHWIATKRIEQEHHD